GTDAALFNINASTGVVSFKAPPDFEAPADQGGNNVYDITLTASDGSLSSVAKAVAITVTNVNEAPSITSGGTASFAENATGAAYTAIGSDPDAGASLTYSLGGTDAALFSINASTGAVTFKTPPDATAPADDGTDNVYDITLTASDGVNSSAARAVGITVTHAKEAINLSSLNGTNGFRLDGVAQDDQSGYAVASAGDVNGDGYGDVIIGAVSAGANGTASGASYVVFGKASGFAAAINLATLGTVNGPAGFRLDGASSYDHSGVSVASAGDVNGDGFADLIIGAHQPSSLAHNDGRNGDSYVVFGTSSGFASAINLATLGTQNGPAGFRLHGAEGYDNTGVSVASAGDVNGDGFADLIIGAPQPAQPGMLPGKSGASYVVFGKSAGFALSINLSSLNGTDGFRLDGAAIGDRSGISVASAGDVNGDGLADMIIGAGYVVFGKTGGWGSALSLAALDGSNGFKLAGVSADDRAGYCVASAGDVNGDGFADIIIGADQADTTAGDAGASYVVFGKASFWDPSFSLARLDGSNGFRLNGTAAGAHGGACVASAGDVNGDGFADLIIGASGTSPNGSNSGTSYVVFGKASGWDAAINLGSLKGLAGFQLNGVSTGDASGSAVASAGDMNGDGLPDLIIGAAGAQPNGSASGSSYVYVSAVSAGATYRGTSLADTLRGTAFSDTMNGYAGNDTIGGGAGNDSINGGAGDDLAVLSGVQSQYRFGLRDGVLITSGADGLDQFSNIERFKWGAAAEISITSLAAIGANLGLFHTRLGNGEFGYSLPDPYTGPLAGIVNQQIDGDTNDIVMGTTLADFFNSGAGDDAIHGGDGNDVIDGGLGSNFITGGRVTIWGYKPGVSKFYWAARDGAQGYQGATLHGDLDGNGLTDTSLSFTGLTQAQLPMLSHGSLDGQDYIFFG
ncbi:MAG: hypothetical protein EBX37_09075, partial [Alphaproteobacteria bacterium]|nr:hypothetical protein [Alphaproteobacteria bacterium]